MSTSSIGVAVIGAGMAGKAHAAAYRNAPALYDSILPEVRLVSIADAYAPQARQPRNDSDMRDPIPRGRPSPQPTTSTW